MPIRDERTATTLTDAEERALRINQALAELRKQEEKA